MPPVSAATCSCALAFAGFQFVRLRRQRAAFLRAFLFLRGEALHFVNDRVDFLVQQRAWNFAAR